MNLKSTKTDIILNSSEDLCYVNVEWGLKSPSISELHYIELCWKCGIIMKNSEYSRFQGQMLRMVILLNISVKWHCLKIENSIPQVTFTCTKKFNDDSIFRKFNNESFREISCI